MGKADFYPEEIERIREAWTHLIEVKSAGSGSAFGEHYVLAEVLKSCGVDLEFEASSQIEYVAEYIITYGRVPDVY